MCGFSQAADQRRDAIEGEELVMRQLTHTKGLTPRNEPEVAACLRPGTKVSIQNLSNEAQQRYGVGEQADATFFERQPTHRDGNPDHETDWLRFENGRSAPLMHIPLDTVVNVLTIGDLPATNFEDEPLRAETVSELVAAAHR